MITIVNSSRYITYTYTYNLPELQVQVQVQVGQQDSRYLITFLTESLTLSFILPSALDRLLYYDSTLVMTKASTHQEIQLTSFYNKNYIYILYLFI